MAVFNKFMERLKETGAQPEPPQPAILLTAFIKDSQEMEDTSMPELCDQIMKFIEYNADELAEALCLDDVSESLEKFICLKLYNKLCLPCELDRAMDIKMSHLRQWLTLTDLEGPTIDPKLLDYAVVEFRKLMNFRSAKDKLTLILNTIKIIAQVLTKASQFSAENLLPSLIYVICQVRPDCLHTNVEYVYKFRYDRLLEEDKYLFMTFVSACKYLENLHVFSSSSRDGFMQAAADLPDVDDIPSDDEPLMLSYLNVKVGDLKISELEQLLMEYRLMAKQLCKYRKEDVRDPKSPKRLPN